MPRDEAGAILNVSHFHFVQGGSDRYFFDLTAMLEAHGHRVVPFCSADPRNTPSPYADTFPKGISTESAGLGDVWKSLYSAEARRNMSRVLEQEPIRLAHLQIYYGQLSGSILKPLKEAGIPIVSSLHEYKLICPVYTLLSGEDVCEDCTGGQYWRALPRRCNRGSLARTAVSVMQNYAMRSLGALDAVDHFVAVSHFMRRKMLEAGVAEDRISTVHNFVHHDRFEPVYKPGDYVLYYGRMERLKGVYTVLEAARQMPEMRFVLVGDGAELPALREEVEREALSNVEIRDFLEGDALRSAISGALCVVVPSEWYEPFGLTALEALASGKPVIAARIGGLQEVIEEHQDGLYMTPGDAGELVAGIRQLDEDRALAEQFGRSGRAKVEERFSAGAHYAAMSEVYRRVS